MNHRGKLGRPETKKQCEFSNTQKSNKSKKRNENSGAWEVTRQTKKRSKPKSHTYSILPSLHGIQSLIQKETKLSTNGIYRGRYTLTRRWIWDKIYRLPRNCYRFIQQINKWLNKKNVMYNCFVSKKQIQQNKLKWYYDKMRRTRNYY